MEMFCILLATLNTPEEKQAFAELYEGYRFVCFKIANDLTRNPQIAWDAVHDAFERAMGDKENFLALPCNKQRSLIGIITRGKAIDAMRASSERKKADISDAEQLADDCDVLFEVESNEQYEHMVSCVQKLPEIYGVVLFAKYIYGMSYAEIGKITGLTTSDVGVHIHRGKQKLRKLMEEGGKNG